LASFGRLPVSSSVVGVCAEGRGGECKGDNFLTTLSLSLSRNFQQKQQVKLGSKSSSDFEAKTPEVYISI